jgi:hypothetical protein
VELAVLVLANALATASRFVLLRSWISHEVERQSTPVVASAYALIRSLERGSFRWVGTAAILGHRSRRLTARQAVARNLIESSDRHPAGAHESTT